MKLDITLPITPSIWYDAKKSEKTELEGHLGTHFDVMEQEFPLSYTERRGVVFDVSAVENGEIDLADIDPSRIEADTFVLFYTGFSDKEPYGSRRYFKEHPTLSLALIDLLLEKRVSIIGLDFAGARRGAEHIPTDSRCAAREVFIVENLTGLGALLDKKNLLIHTYPLRAEGLSGLPCRVIAQVE